MGNKDFFIFPLSQRIRTQEPNFKDHKKADRTQMGISVTALQIPSHALS